MCRLLFLKWRIADLNLCVTTLSGNFQIGLKKFQTPSFHFIVEKGFSARIQKAPRLIRENFHKQLLTFLHLLLCYTWFRGGAHVQNFACFSKIPSKKDNPFWARVEHDSFKHKKGTSVKIGVIEYRWTDRKNLLPICEFQKCKRRQRSTWVWE